MTWSSVQGVIVGTLQESLEQVYDIVEEPNLREGADGPSSLCRYLGSTETLMGSPLNLVGAHRQVIKQLYDPTYGD